MASYYYKVAAADSETPDVDADYRVIRKWRPPDPGNFIIETQVELQDYIETVSAGDPVVTSHLDWWALHPEDDPGWVEV